MSTVVVVGSVNVDLVVQVPKLPSPGETVIGGTFSISHGGKGANQAVAAARLGARTYMVGAVGTDSFAEQAREALVQEGVDISWLYTKEGPTGVAEIMVDKRGENLIAVASGANALLTAQDVRAALDAVLCPGAAVLSNLEIPDEAVMAAAEAAREHGCLFVLNPAPARPLPKRMLELSDVLTPNEHEAYSLGLPSPEELLEAGVGAVVVTRGAEGADLLRRDRAPVHQRAFAVQVVDTTGAGDAFTGTLAWALAEGRPIEEALVLASAAGALATTRVGARAGMASREEVEALAGLKGAARS
jgi:ribokinase